MAVVGTILEGPCPRMPFYTDLRSVFRALGGREREFDWLLTDLDCNRYPPELPDESNRFITGPDLSDLVMRQSTESRGASWPPPRPPLRGSAWVRRRLRRSGGSEGQSASERPLQAP